MRIPFLILAGTLAICWGAISLGAPNLALAAHSTALRLLQPSTPAV